VRRRNAGYYPTFFPELPPTEAVICYEPPLHPIRMSTEPIRIAIVGGGKPKFVSYSTSFGSSVSVR
jgi:hypothetical protein